MRRKTVWLGLLAAAVAVLSAGPVLAVPTSGERALSAGEMGGTYGTCCKDDYIDSQACSTTNSWPCLSCITGPALCGIGRNYSGNVIEQCIDGTGGVCLFTVAVDCYQNIPCHQSEPIFYECKVTGGACDIDLTTNCVLCAPGTPGPWITRDSYICDE